MIALAIRNIKRSLGLSSRSTPRLFSSGFVASCLKKMRPPSTQRIDLGREGCPREHSCERRSWSRSPLSLTPPAPHADVDCSNKGRYQAQETQARNNPIVQGQTEGPVAGQANLTGTRSNLYDYCLTSLHWKSTSVHSSERDRIVSCLV